MWGVRVDGPQPFLWSAWVCAALTIVYVVGAPFWSAAYPMMTDFPFHTAAASVFRHYGDADWHFREQFTFQPFSVPYVSFYALSAALMFVLPPVAATKLAAFLLLALLPIGLMVLCAGMGKSPFLGLWGVVPVWGVLTHWGFVSYMAAIGLFALALGLAFRLVERPSLRGQIGLFVCLALLFFTHVFRLPFALLAIVMVALFLREEPRGVGALLWVVALTGALFGTWWYVRAEALSSAIQWVWPPAWERLSVAKSYLYDTLAGEEDLATFWRVGALFVVTVVVLWILKLVVPRYGSRSRSPGTAYAIVALAVVMFLGLYLTLPMQIGIWWFVFPREITAAVFLLPALLLPDLPNRTWAHLGFVLWTSFATLPVGELAVRTNREFAESTIHFRELVDELPQAPKVLYLVFDHTGSSAKNSPYVHLPAYIQAERGGWLSFHFAGWGAGPFRYRPRDDEGAVVPPATPLRWEWTPERFRLRDHGAFFDWFLVRKRQAPDELFAADRSIKRVAHFENWWLYRRGSGSTGPEEGSP